MTAEAEPGLADGPAAKAAKAANIAAALERRARALARVPEEEAADEVMSVLAFTIGDRRYAVEVGYVREVVADIKMSRVPWAPPAVAGVVNVRGEILTVAHLGHLFGDPTPARGGVMVVLDGPAPPLGLLVDQVDDLVDLPPGALASAPVDTTSPGHHRVAGVSSAAVVLDGGALLSDPRLNTSTDRSAHAVYQPSPR